MELTIYRERFAILRLMVLTYGTYNQLPRSMLLLIFIGVKYILITYPMLLLIHSTYYISARLLYRPLIKRDQHKYSILILLIRCQKWHIIAYFPYRDYFIKFHLDSLIISITIILLLYTHYLYIF